ncbi:MAG TPA: TonB family protein [Steroidobacteraceae bacterium]|jgi:TonB family protein|nr:TonB family protein [Steroidobacteraceae bacterium]
MTVSRWVKLSGTALLAGVALSQPARSAPPVPGVVRDADIAIGFEPKKECPDLTHADAADRTAALVLLLVGPTGVPTRVSVKSSSGSQTLDAAAVSCVQRLRFLPAVHAGDGNAIDSWQEIAWKWGRSHSETATAGAARAVVVTSATMAVGAAPGTAAASAQGSAEARVCLDASGALAQQPAITRSSGDADLDGAALRAARSAASGAAGRGGCLRVTVTAEGASHEGAR